MAPNMTYQAERGYALISRLRSFLVFTAKSNLVDSFMENAFCLPKMAKFSAARAKMSRVAASDGLVGWLAGYGLTY